MASARITSRHETLRWNAPLGAEHPDALQRRAGATGARALLDLGSVRTVTEASIEEWDEFETGDRGVLGFAYLVLDA